ncbi:hypothetical protein BH10PSE17_BH10PSE17_02480 [soil metagenome]
MAIDSPESALRAMVGALPPDLALTPSVRQALLSAIQSGSHQLASSPGREAEAVDNVRRLATLLTARAAFGPMDERQFASFMFSLCPLFPIC